MSARLPVVLDDEYGYAVADRQAGEMVALADASDHAIAAAAIELADHDRRVLELKRALAHELRTRHGVGKATAGGHSFTIAESQSWPATATGRTLLDLTRSGAVSHADAERCMPTVPKPDARALKALLGRLMVSDPDAARVLAAAATVSPPSLRDVRAVAVDEAAV